ncbi:hypothetical protein V0U79_13040 [Hyphobacterium sp. HN65]|uniref:Uncharacterized protein n=1 Tax=Hyphobacterium lacteum TaxID=3116575 RepID=A0ABU7LTM9_9PROT|nr:hypothetical protein [Hyphobacterium sp. HN65]MEE2527285.1 hypothetical protein [Hyphobacterium sp. HN65]
MKSGLPMAFNVRTIFAFAMAALMGGVLTSILSTQIILRYLETAGAIFPLATRAQAIWLDLNGFAPTLIALSAIGYAIAFPVARLISRRIGALRTTGYMLSGYVMIIVMIFAIELFYQTVLGSTITPIAAGRDVWGLAVIGLGGAAGGWVFAVLSPRKP